MLRGQVSYVLGLLVFVSGALAGVALADGLPPVLGTSVALPTVSVPTPVATATVATPTVTTPAVTSPVATTVALPAVTTSAAKPVATVTTPAVPPVPAKTVPVAVPAVPAVPAKTVSVAVTAKPAVQAAGASVSVPVPAVHASGVPAPPSAPLAAAAGVAPSASSIRAAPAEAAHAVTSASLTVLQEAQAALPPLAPPAEVASGPVRAALTLTDPRRDAAGRPLDASTSSVLVSPLVSQIGTAALPSPSAVPEIRAASPAATSTWSSIRAHPAAMTGGLMALTALAALGLAGLARSPATVAACAELARFPFPRFRVLPCPGSGATAELLGSGTSALGSAGAAEAQPVTGGRSHPSAGNGFGPGQQVVPRLGGVLGAGISTSNPWQVLKTALLAMLAAANVVLLAVRWRLGRLQGP